MHDTGRSSDFFPPLPCPIELLGALRVTYLGQEVSHSFAPKIGGLLGYLACFLHRSHPRDVLIELLVVVTAIVILAVILFPAFAQARAKAHQATCASHLAQIAVAGMMYVQDNDERFPSCYSISAPPYVIDPRTSLQPYVKNWDLFYCPDRQREQLRVRGWACPVAALPRRALDRRRPVGGAGYEHVQPHRPLGDRSRPLIRRSATWATATPPDSIRATRGSTLTRPAACFDGCRGMSRWTHPVAVVRIYPLDLSDDRCPGSRWRLC
jgi:competence protein ComGC